MEISNLAAFIQVAETGSFSTAARLLYLTQPAVSKRVSALESELGTTLFDRIGRQISLTEAGRQLLPRAKRLLDEMADLKRVVSNQSGIISGPLVMGTSHHIGLHRLPDILRSYNDAFPQVKLDIRFQSSEHACTAVEQGELELAVITLPNTPPENLQLQRIWHDPLAIMVGRSHPLAGQASVSIDTLLSHSAVLPGEATYTRRILQDAVAGIGQEIQCSLSTNYLETLKMMTVIGLGWSLLPVTMLDDNLLRIEVEGIRLSRWLGVVTHQRRTLSNAARTMLERIGTAD